MARATYILGLGSIILGQLTPSLAQVVTDVVSITDTSTIISCADTVTNCPGKTTASGYAASVVSTASVASEVTSKASSWVAPSAPAAYTAPAAGPSTVTVTETATGDCGASVVSEVASSISSNSMWWPPASETAASGVASSAHAYTSVASSWTSASAWGTGAKTSSKYTWGTAVTSAPIVPTYASDITSHTTIQITSDKSVTLTTYSTSTVQTKTSGSTVWTTTTGWLTVVTCDASTGSAYATGYGSGYSAGTGYYGTGTLVGPYNNSTKIGTGTAALETSALETSAMTTAGAYDTSVLSFSTATPASGSTSKSTLYINPPSSTGISSEATGINGTTGAQQTTISADSDKVRISFVVLGVVCLTNLFLF
ncbi:uncharacterized protein EAE97_008475 [Botrytis byssoidea]|uniref:Ig-like domain-containing protein n=1 Tax=Botrytis byssoidea TaxID=139641 RepID=A0A9P5LYD0_9HELO|nr:uncharacterized protein EAE97_008475 [Botrytis byssoidea]KAF7934115.1 hypothetical protein EAE97_008475 [Botrytis byssoidea]